MVTSPVKTEVTPLRQKIRHTLGSIKPLRIAWHLALAAYYETRWQPVNRSGHTKLYARRPDPWGYGATPDTSDRFRAGTELLDRVRQNARFKRGWEIGCAEGRMTACLAPICEQLCAVDYIPLALERARLHCQEFANISFQEWDLKSDPAPGSFDLIVITDVLGSLGGRSDIRRARDKVVGALAASGYLLYGDYLGWRLQRRLHNSWLGRLLLLRPPTVLRLVAGHPELVEVARRETSMHLLVLFRRKH
jgi:SAM-dependent methyltransferase